MFHKPPTGWLKFERGPFDSRFGGGGLEGRWGRRLAHSIARPWVPISNPLTQMVYLLPFLPLDEVMAYRVVFVIVSGADGRTETLLESAK